MVEFNHILLTPVSLRTSSVLPFQSVQIVYISRALEFVGLVALRNCELAINIVNSIKSCICVLWY